MHNNAWARRATWLALIGVAILAVAVSSWLLANRSVSPAQPQQGAADAVPAFQFTHVTDTWGIDFIHDPGPASFFFPAITGSGVGLLDFDQDGDLDIYVCNGTSGSPHPLAQSDAQPSQNRLYRQDADQRFKDVTQTVGVGENAFGMGVAIGDVNNDGYPDILSVSFGVDRLFINDRGGSFRDVTETAGVGDPQWGSSATFVDFDRDGRLDLFVVNYVDYSRPVPCKRSSGIEDFCLPLNFAAAADRLYRNVTTIGAARSDPTQVRFEDVSQSSRIADRPGRGLGVRAGDFNHDGWPDLFVANDSEENSLWINQHDGTFRDLAIPWGVALDASGRAQASMGIAEGDADGDGLDDLAVTGLRGEYTILYRRRTVSGYEDVGNQSGVAAVTRPLTGFGVAMPDLDHDGDIDLVVVNGRVVQPEGQPIVQPPAARSDPQGAMRFWNAYGEPNLVLQNDGTGRFFDCTAQSGDFRSAIAASRGLALGDLDNDGDLDVVVSNIATALDVYRNDVAKAGHWLMVRTIDPALGGRDAYGARVTVEASGKRWHRVVQPGTSYQSSDDPRVHFGLGSAAAVGYIEIQWPDGQSERFAGGPADRLVTIARGDGRRDARRSGTIGHPVQRQ